ncbi:hypothetical protein [Microcella alkaliphila]|uniref:Uncharacterized protein n=1 Tax=Microcella alkaliphila TaxID=279828 RepID=A0A0U5BT95_9MICO|nr:hypothetical protein [Microcella alkaliphila]BAU31645.1 putative uncharacterized protein [Microcella alkaliphila]
MGDDAPVRAAAGGASDDTTLEATGRRSADWYGMLDAAGARDWPHKQIAGHLVAAHGVDGWWAQSITVGYEQAAGGARERLLLSVRPAAGKPATVSLTWSGMADDHALSTVKGRLAKLLDTLP